MYDSETWTLSQARISISERNILRKITGSLQDNGEWRIRHNDELYQITYINHQYFKNY